MRKGLGIGLGLGYLATLLYLPRTRGVTHIREQLPLREVAQHFDLRELPHSESYINVLFGWDCIEEQYPHCEKSGRLHFLKRKMTFMIISRFIGIWDFNCAIAIRGWKYARDGVPKITIRITRLHEILGRDYGNKIPYWGPSIRFM